jgi:hypothetical integral membrane protein (TIGR02206 family)
VTALAADGFPTFSGQHMVLLVIFVVGLVAAARWGRSHRDTEREHTSRRRFAVAVAVAGLATQLYQLTPGDFDLGTSLPLQLCDLATVASVIALWTRDPRAAAFTYYVGLTLTVQGVITPSLAEAFPHPRYFGYWAIHFLVVWAAAYLTWGLGVRPTWRLYGFTLAAAATWAVCAFSFNVVAGTNYGYLNRKPSSASLLDVLGPWPWYLLIEVGVIALAWALLLTVPWYRTRLHGHDRPATTTGMRDRR